MREYQAPVGFSSRKVAKTTIESLRKGETTLTPEDVRLLGELDNLLATAAFGLASENEITFAMIKPKANEGIGLPADDDEAAQAIIAEIGKDNVALQFHALLNLAQGEELYGAETIARLWKTDSEITGIPVAEILFNYITSDSVTMLLVSRPNDDPVNWLMEKVGATKPSRADPNSIRGRYGRDEMLPNNLIHRSDSIGSVIREINGFQLIVRDFINFGVNNHDPKC